jgi:hypothetical protein
MSSTTVVPASNVSQSKKTVRRFVEGQALVVLIPTGATVTSAFAKIAAALEGISLSRRPNRSGPINCGFSSVEEKQGWDAASDEAWESIDAE